MYGPAYHRRQADILARIAKTISNAEAAAALSELAAKHRELADEGERAAQQRRQVLSKKDRPPSPQHR
jgi:hypothetical protein